MSYRERQRNSLDTQVAIERRRFAIRFIREEGAKGDSITYWLTWLLDREPTLEECIDMAAEVDAASDRDYYRPIMRELLDDWHNDPVLKVILEELLGEGLGALQSERSEQANGHVRGQNGHVRNAADMGNNFVRSQTGQTNPTLKSGGFVGGDGKERGNAKSREGLGASQSERSTQGKGPLV